jgi:hypothetical protein
MVNRGPPPRYHKRYLDLAASTAARQIAFITNIENNIVVRLSPISKRLCFPQCVLDYSSPKFRKVVCYLLADFDGLRDCSPLAIGASLSARPFAFSALAHSATSISTGNFILLLDTNPSGLTWFTVTTSLP